MELTTFHTLTCLVALVLAGQGSTGPVPGRSRRSDDLDPLEAVVGGLSEKVDHLTAQLQAQDSQLKSQGAVIAAMEQPVAFTATFPSADIMKNMAHDGDVEVDLYKESKLLVRAGACCTGHVSGANMATVHLETGETIRLQLSRGTMVWGSLHSTFSGFKLSPN
ncbi:hypothetical protein BaRGS_00012121 [Batillaria attramentaria]|uniref:C1q domain-containing protein n=1 Tax=Batillaria attramentaria TaxID=370345 RepID=A0ABD0LBD8_9CAEN